MALRHAAVAGSWYPGEPEGLTAELSSYFAAASVPSLAGRVVGLISPHAGMVYSGPVAAHAYKTLLGRSNLTAVLVGPSHRMAFHGAAVYVVGEFETPLGRIPVDERLAARMLTHPLILDAPRPHRDEHSLEMQLPFLQHAVKGLKIVPILMGAQTREEVDALAPAIATAAEGRDDVVLVASSDLSHYHPAPLANRLDALVVDDVGRFDADGLMNRLEGRSAVAADLAGAGHACGGGPMVAVMRASRALGASTAAVLCYADSGDAGPRDKSHVVGYLAAALVAP